MSTSKTYQQSLADVGSKNRPPMLERGSYIPWASRFRRYLNRKRDNRKWLLKALDEGPYEFKNFLPEGLTIPRLQTIKDLEGDDLLLYDAEMELMNMILLSIPNEIYNSVDACTSAKDMWKRVERLMRGTIQNRVDREMHFTNEFDQFVVEPGEALVSVYNHFAQLMNDLERNNMNFLTQFEKLVNTSRAKKLEKSHDPLALRHHTGSSSRQTSSYYVTHPTSVVDYDDDGKGHYARNCPKPRVRDSKYFMKQMLLAKQDEAGVILTDEQNDFLFADASRMEEIEYHTIGDDKINSTIKFDSFKGNVNSGSVDKDTHVPDLCAVEKLARNAYQEAEKQRIFAKQVQTQNTHLTSQIEMYKERVRILEGINKDNNYLNEFLEADKRAKRYKKQAQSQLVRDRDIIRDLEKQQDKLDLNVKNYKRKNEELQKTHSILKRQMSEKKDTYHDTILDLEAKLKKNVDLILKLGNSLQGMFMLGPKPLSMYDQQLKHGLEYSNPYILKQAISKCPKLYVASSLELSVEQKYFPSSSIPLVKIPVSKNMPSESPLIKELDKIKVGFEKLSLLIQQNCKRASIFYTSPAEIEINDFCQDQVKPILNELKVYLECFRNLFQRDIKEMKDVFESTESELDELEKQNELLKDQLLEASLKHDVELCVLINHECVDKILNAELEKVKKKSFENQEDLQARIKILEKYVVQIVLWVVDKAITGYRADYINGISLLSWYNYVEGLGHNLFSVGQFCDGDLEVAFRSNTCYVRNLEGDDLLTGGRDSNLYTISISDMAASSPVCLMSKATSTKSWLWHRRLSHLNFGTINDLTRLDLVDSLPKFKYGKDHLCSACEREKSKKASHPPKLVPSDYSKLELLHMDLCGPMRVALINGKKYILVIVDNFSRYTWVYFLLSKDETLEIIKKFITQAQLNYKAKVCKIRTDNGTEFKNATLKAHYEKLGIMQQFSIARTPQQNGVVERRNHTLVEAARTMLIFSKSPEFLWAEAVATACFTQNRSIIHTRYNKTPYELLRGRKLNIAYFHVFGSLCYPTNVCDDLGKMKPKADIKNIMSRSLLIHPVAQPTQVHEDLPSTSSIIVETHEAPPVVTTSDEQNSPISLTKADEINQEDTANFDGNAQFIPYNPPSHEEIKSSTTALEPSNVHIFHQVQPSTHIWTKDHPLNQVIGAPSKRVMTRQRLHTDSEMVNTRTDAELAAAVQAAVDAMLPQIREQVREEYRTGASGSNPPPVTIHTWLERFNKQKPHSFEKAVAPVDAENWISHMEKIFDVMDCNDAFKTRLAVYKFEGDALAWWKAYKQAKGGDAWVLTLTWAAFKELFFLQFFPRAEQERLKREYHSIRQRASENSTEYMQRFLRLAGFLGQAAGTA
ncbi:retrovirus-related pol polyprotein from transposon TNT 1-94 [Tanacetum coccineum]|uniref:Retrovirus-related pol polyprotein from transposon TNT 1-94 n=1 Tax=Tanacetum coccineum TaxID=301880 RepID=A0ABQ5CKC2_9ASTR